MVSALTVNSSTACVAWDNVHLRVYFQDNEGYVRESQWDGSWTGGKEGNRLFRAKPNSPLMAICWGSVHIRVYYIDNNNILQEHCWDGHWYNGALGSRQIKVDYRSKIAACSWTETPHIRVYYQAPYDGKVREECWDGNGWTTGATLMPAALGSGLAAVAFGSVHLRVYYQDQNRIVKEHCWDGGWQPGATLGEAITGTGISAITWSNDPQLRVYYEKEGIVEMAYSHGWSGPQQLTNALTGTSLSCCCWGNIHIRFYYQQEPSQVQEFCWDGRWAKGSVIPTSN